MAEQTEYAVLLVHRDDNLVEGMHVYRGEELPEPNDVITVEGGLSPVPILIRPPKTSRARVTRVVPGDKFPVRAVEIEP